MSTVDFTLDEQLIEQIIFAMEDQQHEYFLHGGTGELVRAEEVEKLTAEGGEQPFLPIPDWQPAHGFHLMERFVARLRNPLLRDELKEALASGKGVFRKFKNILKGSREIERFWYTFKERELRKIVWQWYNDQRELAGLERLQEEPEETDGIEDLLITDFSILPAAARHAKAIEWLDREAFAAAFPGADRHRVAELYRRSRKRAPGTHRHGGPPEGSASAAAPGELTGELTLAAETPERGFAGFVWGVEERDPLLPGRILCIRQLAVLPRYQGIGLGGLLLKAIIGDARDRGYHRVRSELLGTGLKLAGFFEHLGFRQISQVVELDPTRWEG